MILGLLVFFVLLNSNILELLFFKMPFVVHRGVDWMRSMTVPLGHVFQVQWAHQSKDQKP
ncbi:MAG: hypothetical protein ACJA01_003839 [Saprospiraceae bacterium]|jgi:hypothetical protein